MAVSTQVPTLLSEALGNKEIDIDSDSIKIMWTTSTWTFNQDTHKYKSDVTNEVSGSGYTAGGVSVGTVTKSVDTATNTTKYDAADVTITATVTNARRAVIYDATPGTDATRPILAVVDYGADRDFTTGFTHVFHADGFLNMVAT